MRVSFSSPLGCFKVAQTFLFVVKVWTIPNLDHTEQK